MISNSSCLFTEGMYVKACLVKAKYTFCPDKKKVFESISLSVIIAVCSVTNLADNGERL